MIEVKTPDTDIDNGLSMEEVDRLTRAGLYNEPVKSQSKSVWQIIAGNVFTYFNLIFAIFAALLILVRSYINMTFLPILIINTMIGIVQEIRTKHVLDKLTLLNAPKTRVIREGGESEVDSETLVQGDLCVFSAGKQICADARIVRGNVRVNESLVTGESDEITKSPGDALLSGSYVVSGECRAVLEHVGLSSYASKIALEAKASRKKQQTEMMRSLDKLVKVIGIAIIPIGLLMFCSTFFFLKNSFQQSVVSVIAALVGMIPEGLYLLASVALVVSVMRLGRKKVLVHEMACVETLARVNVLCVDKTGTITEEKMSVSEVVPLENYNTGNYPSLHEMIGNLVNNLPADNITVETLKEYFNAEHSMDAESICPFSSETKYSAAAFGDGQVYIMGAPEKVLLERYGVYRKQIERYARRGLRVMIFGVCSVNPAGKPIQKPIEPLALIVLGNAIRDDAKETFKYFADQGVEIKVISGDNPITVSSVAKDAGIAGAENCVDASSLDTDEKLAEAAVKYTVFGRVQPDQKRRIVQALKASGKVVAMTGDGVNDVLALKSADCSVAFRSGSDAACNAAQIVLLESNFSCMPSVVLEGRRVVNNIQRTAALFLVKNIFSMLLAVFTLIAGHRYPLYPTQLSLLGAFTIGAPGFLLALQPNKNIISGNFLVNVTIKALPAALTDFLLVALFSLYSNFSGIPHEQLSTTVAFILLTVGMAELVRVCKPLNWIRTCICAAMGIGIVISVIFFGELFAISALTPGMWVHTIIWMVCSIPIFYVMCRLVGKLFDRFL